MTLQAVLSLVWSFLNSPVGIAAVASLALYLLTRLYAVRPGWRQYEGTIIAAVKYAEAAIPDDAPDKGVRRLDAALKYVLRVYEERQGAPADPATRAELTEGIQIVHSDLESAGGL